MFKEVSMCFMGETPDNLQIYIPTSEEFPSPFTIQVPGVATTTRAAIESHEPGLNLWMRLVELLNLARFNFTSCSIVPSSCKLLPI